MYTRELEKLARSFLAQKMDVAYVRHYLMETYQLDVKTADEIIAKVAPAGGRSGKNSGAHESVRAAVVKRSKFY
jgi:hypothetical protein